MSPQVRKEIRRNPRTQVSAQVDVVGDCSCRDALMLDMSVSGAAVTIPPGKVISGGGVCLKDEVVLIVKGRAHIPGRVVRLFDGGFAVQFDWSIDVDRRAEATAQAV